jgi:hypothetical protein
MKLFGFSITRASDQETGATAPVSFVEPQNDDGAITVGGSLGGFYTSMLDMEGSAKTESELITRYRNLAMQPEITQAIDEIVNEAINIDTNDQVVEVVLDDADIPDKIQDKIRDEFSAILALLDFTNAGYDIFSKFYVDGRLNYHVMIDENDLKKGIVELRYVDPRKLKLIREMSKSKAGAGEAQIPTKQLKNEFYIYSDSGFGGQNSGGPQQGIKIAKDSIARVTSGIVTEDNSMVLSHLHPTMKPLNQLRMLEDATVIYTLTRAPERRIFYIDVGNLPKNKAEQYLRDMMTRHKNKLQYNSSTGEITDGRKMMTMTEDFWFPRRGGERTTEVDTLAGGSAQALSTDENLQYFQRKLYKALRVPLSRLEPEAMYSFGRVSEITRDELKFGKFIRRIRARFANIFIQLLEKQLVLKGIMNPDDFAQIKNDIRFDFIKENYFEELKQAEILRERLETLTTIEEYKGQYYSKIWIQKNVLQMSEEDIEEVQQQIEDEKASGDGEDEFGDMEMDLDPRDIKKSANTSNKDTALIVDSKEKLEESQLKLLDSMTKFIESE